VNVTIESKDQVVLVRVDELQIGADNADDFKTRVHGALPEEGGRLAIDLSKVDFVDSSGLGALVSLLKTLRPAGEMVLFGIRPSVGEILRLTHLDAIFRREETEQAALAQLAKTGSPE
jgi:anti-sigma B factor antagonist